MKVSVIVPVYNVESYIYECLCSLDNQNFNDYEVLLIDDGSTDNSSNICISYVKNRKKFKYFKKQNEGLSSARNFGINQSNGEWIMFVDSDDIIDKNFISFLYYSTIKNNCQIGICGYKRFSDKLEFHETPINSKIVLKNDFILEMFSSNFMIAWNKIYKKSLFNDIKFPVGCIHEDFATVYKLIDKVENVNILSNTLYYYRINTSGITLSKIKNNKVDLLNIYLSQIFYLKDKKNNYPYDILYYECCNSFFSCIGTIVSYKKNLYDDYVNFYALVSKFYRTNYSLIKKLPLSAFNKICLALSCKHIYALRTISCIKRFFKHE